MGSESHIWGRASYYYRAQILYLVIYEEAVSLIWLCTRSLLKFLIFESNSLSFFIRVQGAVLPPPLSSMRSVGQVEIIWTRKLPPPPHWDRRKAVNRGDKRSRRYRYRDFAKFERSRRYQDRYRCQEKKSRRGRDFYLVFRDPPPPRTRARSLIANR